MLGHMVPTEDKKNVKNFIFPAPTPEVLASKRLFQEILERIHRLKPAGIGYG
jgi:hypothetical protein